MTAELDDSEWNSILASFGQRVKKCHRDLEKAQGGDRITQKDLGARVGRSGGAVSEWERGEAMPDVFTLTRLARLFKRTLAWMVSGEGDSEVQPSTPRELRQDDAWSVVQDNKVMQITESAAKLFGMTPDDLMGEKACEKLNVKIIPSEDNSHSIVEVLVEVPLGGTRVTQLRMDSEPWIHNGRPATRNRFRSLKHA